MPGHRNKLIWIEPPLASGGMADVWRVINPGAAGVQNISVVKRILLNYVQNEDFKKMFVDEAKITTQLHKPIPHPNIIQVQKFIEYEDEYLLFLEYVNGPDVRRIISKCVKEETEFPIEYALYIIAEALNGLYHAHNLHLEGRNINVIHRDISPQNILVSYSGEVKVIDWGIADTEIKTTETVVGVIKGKYGYMSPEQANGDELDYKTDIYSIGVVLWEMLTARRLFAHKNDLKVLRKIQKSEIDAPKKFNREISRNLNNIVLKALNRKREKRYKDCLEFANELTRERNSIAPNFSKVELAQFLQKNFDEEIKKDQLIVSQAEKQAPSEIPPTARDPKFGRRQRERVKPKKQAPYGDIVSIGSIKESGIELEDESVISDAASLTPTPYDSSKVGITASKSIEAKPKSLIKRLSFMPILMLLFISIVTATIIYMKDRQTAIMDSSKTKATLSSDDMEVIGNLKIRPATGRNLRVASELTGFIVRIKGLNYKYIKGERDLFIEDLEPQSSYLVEISKPGFETVTKQVEIDDNTTVTLPVNHLTAIREAGNLFIETVPEGAQIFVNGIKKEIVTPNTIRLPVKEKFEIKIERYGYASEDFKVMFTEGGGLIRKKFVLKPQKIIQPQANRIPSELKIYSVPAGAVVYINNKLVCKKTPCTYNRGVVNETLKVEMRLRGYKIYNSNFSLRSEKVNVLSHQFTKLTKIYGYLSLSSFPDGKIYINGKYIGKTTPIEKLKLKAGKYKITIVGVKDKKKVSTVRYINVSAGKITKRYYVLK